LPSFGEKLKLEREKRKITLEQISTSTKIGTRMLQALEEEKFTQLPGGIFNKGFVRAYARTLGLDEDQAVADYLLAAGDVPPARLETGVRDHSRDNSRDDLRPGIPHEPESGRLEIRAEVASRQLPWGILAVILLIIALGLSLWNYHRQQERLASPSRPVLKTPVQPATAAGSSPASTSAPAQPAPGGDPAASPAAPVLSPSPPTNTYAAESASQATPAAAEFMVVIRAHDESWLSVFVDGKPAGAETLRAGDERTFRGHERITVKAGNVGALDLLLNGKPLPVSGDVGEVRTVSIGPAGLVPTPVSAP